MLSEIQKILREDPFSVEVAIHPQTEIRSLPNWDSYKHLTLILTLEERLGKSFAPDDVAKLKTLGDILERLSDARS
jgi:acyl carrier protein